MKKIVKKSTDTKSSKERKSRGRQRQDATFPVAPTIGELPESYASTLGEIKARIRTERLRLVMAANAAMVSLYWDIGKAILERQKNEGWGAKVIDRLSADLREAFPDMKGLSPRNLKYMRAFAAAWPDKVFVQQVAAQIPWFHNCVLIDKVSDPQARIWYAKRAIEEGWSRNILVLKIETCQHQRQGEAISNFALTMPPERSDMAAQVFKDPYLFDFLGTADHRREREIEQALVDHIQRFLLELGTGFAFVGRQVHLEVGDKDFYLDLLFYHLKLRCYVVVELKAVPFDPGFVGTLNLYLSAVDDLLCHPDDKPAIGLLLCKGKDRLIVEYALRGFQKPIGVAGWKTRLVESLPSELKGSLPTVEEIEAELMREGLDEETLAIYDLLVKPTLKPQEIQKIKKVAKELLETLKGKLKDLYRWQDKEPTRDGVKVLIQNFLWDEKTGLPVNCYTQNDVYKRTEAVFYHVYRAYPTVPSPYYA